MHVALLSASQLTSGERESIRTPQSVDFLEPWQIVMYVLVRLRAAVSKCKAIFLSSLDGITSCSHQTVTELFS